MRTKSGGAGGSAGASSKVACGTCSDGSRRRPLAELVLAFDEALGLRIRPLIESVRCLPASGSAGGGGGGREAGPAGGCWCIWYMGTGCDEAGGGGSPPSVEEKLSFVTLVAASDIDPDLLPYLNAGSWFPRCSCGIELIGAA